MHNDTLRQVWDERAEQHAARKKSHSQDFGKELYEASWWKHIEPLLAKIDSGLILEAGCGTGRWVEKLAPKGFEMVLSDISPKMLNKAKQWVETNGYSQQVRFEVADICDLNFLEDQSCNMAIATGEPVTMCQNPQKAISELCRVVRPGGFVLCDAGNRYRKAYDMFLNNPEGPVREILETGKYTNRGGLDLHLLGPCELEKLFQNQCMEVITVAGITPMLTFPPNQNQNNAMNNPDICRMLETIENAFTSHPSMVHISSRLIAVARKP